MTIKIASLFFVAIFISLTIQPSYGGDIISCDSFENCPGGSTLEALEERVRRLEVDSGIEANPDGTCGGSSGLTGVHQVEYRSVIHSPGYEFTLGGIDYVMARIPFVDFITDDRFAVNLPVKKLSDSNGDYLSSSFGVSEKVGSDCSDVRIVGTNINPVNVFTIGDTRSYLYSSDKFETSRLTAAILSVRFQNFKLSVITIAQQKLVSTCSSNREDTHVWSDCSIERLDSDLTDDFDWGPHTEQPRDFMDQIDQWIDYVYVEKLPKDSAPDSPTNVSASDGSYATHVEITWDDVTNEENYKVFRCTSSDIDTCEFIAKLPVDSTAFDDTEAVGDGTIYEYRLKACSTAGGCSNYSISDGGYRIEN